MPIIIDITQNALYKRGARETIEKFNHSAITMMLKDNILSIEKIAQYLRVDTDYVLSIKNELDQKQP